MGSSYDVHAVLQHPETRPAVAAAREHFLKQLSTMKPRGKARKPKPVEDYDPVAGGVD